MSLAADVDGYVFESGVECRLRDGVVLRSDVYRPRSASADCPVLLVRTPYDKSAPLNAEACKGLAQRGYIAVSQDMRGTHTSDGDYDWIWNPASQPREGRDGYDAVEWAARLPGADGRVGTFGVSYASYAQWALAKEKPPSLAAMHTGGYPVSSLDQNFGVFDLGRRLHWIYAQAAEQRARAGHRNGPVSIPQAHTEWLTTLRNKWIWHLPLRDLPDHVFDELTEPYRAFLGIQNEDVNDFAGLHSELDIPVCTITGWWDRLSMCVRHFEALRREGPEKVRDRHRLIIGPWSHSPPTARRDLGPRDYGEAADYPYVTQVADWYDEIFRGTKRSAPQTAGTVNLLLLNDPDWSQFDAWPPTEAEDTTFFIHSARSAKSVYGDGTLSREAPREEEPDTFTYDPADPFMSTMGADAHLMPIDQQVNDHRIDNLVFQSEPLDNDLVVAGYPRCRIWASSSAPDTDFTVKLIEVGADGLAINLTQGIVRARFRHGYESEAMLEPGRTYAFDVTMLPVGIRFSRGSRIRLDISSSDFPAFDRNHNTGGKDWQESELRVAHQTVFHDAERPTQLILPTILT